MFLVLYLILNYVRCWTMLILFQRQYSGTLLLFLWPSGPWHLIPFSSTFSESSLSIWKFLVYVQLKPDLENFVHYFASMWNECNCAVVWNSLALPFFGLERKLTFLSPMPMMNFPYFLTYWVQHFNSIVF